MRSVFDDPGRPDQDLDEVLATHAFPGAPLVLRRSAAGRFALGEGEAGLAALLGLPPEALRESAREILRRTPAGDRRALAEALEASGAALAPFHLRWRYRHPVHGPRRLEAWSTAPVAAEGGLAWHGFLLDLSELAQCRASLRDTEARFAEAFDQAAIGMVLSAPGGRILRANPAFCDLLGYPAEGLPDLNILDLTDPEDRMAAQALRQGLIRGEAARGRLERRMIRRDGGTVWVQGDIAVARHPDGQVRHLISQFQDITEQKAMLARLRSSEEKFSRAFQAAPVLMAISRLEDGTLLEVNEAFCRATGFPRQDLVGRRSVDLGLVDQEGRNRLMAAMGPEGRAHNLDFYLIAKDGRRISCLTSVETVSMAGERLLIALNVDVSDLRESETRFREVFEHSPMALWEEDFSEVAARFRALRCEGVADLRGRLEADPALARQLVGGIRPLQVNAAGLRMMGAATLDDLGGDLGRFCPDAALEVLKDELAALFDGCTSFEAETCRVDLLGRDRVVYLRLTVMPGHEKDLSHVLVTLSDLTQWRAVEGERQRMERELDHLRRLESLGRLAGGVSHDMNNVLGAIMAVASLLKVRHKGDEVIQRDAEAMLQASVRGRDLVKGLRDFSRKELDSPDELDLNELARREADLLERTSLKRVAIRLDLEPDLPAVFGEASSIQNALMNLCHNAMDAMDGKPRPGTLTLATRNLGHGFVELSVADNGEGMPPEVAARALEPFFTTKPTGKGTGLGLSQVYGTLKAHGGSMEIHSEPGRGTRVTLIFPSLGGALPAQPRPAEGPGKPVRPMRILLVDDEEMVRGSLSALLEELGHSAQAATGGLEAMRRLEAGLQVDLVLLDINMPGMDGIETLSRLRTLRPQLPVLLSTGYADDRIPSILKRFKNLRILKKPFSLAELELMLGNWS